MNNYTVTLVDKLDRVHHVKVNCRDRETAARIACNRLRLDYKTVRVAGIAVQPILVGEK